MKKGEGGGEGQQEVRSGERNIEKEKEASEQHRRHRYQNVIHVV